MPCSALSSDSLPKIYDGLLAAAERASTASEWIGWFEEWNRIKCWVEGESNRRWVTYSRNLADESAQEANREFQASVLPASLSKDAVLVRKLLEGPARDALAARYGEYLLELLENAASLSPAALGDLARQEADLVTRIVAHYGKHAVQVADRSMTPAAAKAELSGRDQTQRRAAFDGLAQWVEALASNVSAPFSELLATRRKMAAALGDQSFAGLGYRRLKRVDWGPDDAAVLRSSIKQYILPVLAECRRRRAEALQKPLLSPWDTDFHSAAVAEPKAVPVERQAELARDLCQAVHPDLGSHVAAMIEAGRFDLEDRPHKRSGAFCGMFPDEGQAMVISSSTGGYRDLFNLTHEIGHAYAAVQSAALRPLELKTPGLEACEIHSVTMEHLAMAVAPTVIDQEAAKNLLTLRLLWSLEQIPGYAAFDALHHALYGQQGLEFDGIDALWAELGQDWLSQVDSQGYEPILARRWLRGDFYSTPFYSIDYAIAEIVALQILERFEADPANVETYLRLCRLGGTLPLRKLLAGCDLASPFEPNTVRRTADYLSKKLKLASC